MTQRIKIRSRTSNLKSQSQLGDTIEATYAVALMDFFGSNVLQNSGEISRKVRDNLELAESNSKVRGTLGAPESDSNGNDGIERSKLKRLDDRIRRVIERANEDVFNARAPGLHQGASIIVARLVRENDQEMIRLFAQGDCHAWLVTDGLVQQLDGDRYKRYLGIPQLNKSSIYSSPLIPFPRGSYLLLAPARITQQELEALARGNNRQLYRNLQQAHPDEAILQIRGPAKKIEDRVSANRLLLGLLIGVMTLMVATNPERIVHSISDTFSAITAAIDKDQRVFEARQTATAIAATQDASGTATAIAETASADFGTQQAMAAATGTAQQRTLAARQADSVATNNVIVNNRREDATAAAETAAKVAKEVADAAEQKAPSVEPAVLRRANSPVIVVPRVPTSLPFILQLLDEPSIAQGDTHTFEWKWQGDIQDIQFDILIKKKEWNSFRGLAGATGLIGISPKNGIYSHSVEVNEFPGNYSWKVAATDTTTGKLLLEAAPRALGMTSRRTNGMRPATNPICLSDFCSQP